MEERLIFHIDVNSAYLSWEAASRLKENPQGIDLRTIACAVGGDREKRRGVILAKSIPAKKYGVSTGESIMEALRKCPHLEVVKANHTLYEEYSARFMNLLGEYSPDVEKYSIDEMFMDMSGTGLLFGEPKDIAVKIKDRIHEELGFTVNVGISSNKILAKMASDFEKPDKVHTLFPEEIADKLWPLSVRDLFLVGRATAERLERMGIHTIGELAAMNPQVLEQHLKKHGRIVWEYANGIDVTPVEHQPAENKVYGNSTTLPENITDPSEAKQVLLLLSESVASRLRKDGKRAGVISVGIKDCHFHYASHQMAMPGATDITGELHKRACQLFDELWDGTPIRLLGVQTSHITGDDSIRQLTLFETEDYEKSEKMDAAMDAIRNRFGDDAIVRGTFLKPPKSTEKTLK